MDMNPIYACYGALFGILFPWVVVGGISFLIWMNGYKLMGVMHLMRVSLMLALLFGFLFSLYPS